MSHFHCRSVPGGTHGRGGPERRIPGCAQSSGEATGGVILSRPELYHFRKKYDFALKAEIIIDVLPQD